jgi:hypothetical protein
VEETTETHEHPERETLVASRTQWPLGRNGAAVAAYYARDATGVTGIAGVTAVSNG